MASDKALPPQTLTYATHDGVALQGDLYSPAGTGPFPVMVAVHAGGWVTGTRAHFLQWGPYLAARGIALFAINYRLATNEKKTFPGAVHDVIAGVQYVRGEAKALKLDPERVGLMGASAGAQLAALVALAGKEPIFARGYPQDPYASVDTSVKVLVGIYGVYDLVAMWQHYQLVNPGDNNIEKHLGASPMENRRLYFDASPINYATFANNKLPVFLCTGAEDDIVDRRTQTDAFLLALNQARFFVRNCIVPGAAHYWANEPIDEPGSYTSVLAPRLGRFLADKL